MDNKKYLKQMIKSNQETIKKLIDDISEEESMRHDYEFCNHIRWQTGHLIDTARLVLKLLGERADVSDEWTKLFGYGSVLHDDASIYPSMTALKEKLYGLYDQTLSVVDSLPYEHLEREVELTENWKLTPLAGIPAFCRHEYYHGGQITVMRRVLGREAPFG